MILCRVFQVLIFVVFYCSICHCQSQMECDFQYSSIDGVFEPEISISGDGSIVALGTPGCDINGNNSGYVEVFEITAEGWIRRGQRISGDFINDDFGAAISLSYDGQIIAIGSQGGDGNGSNSGLIRCNCMPNM